MVVTAARETGLPARNPVDGCVPRQLPGQSIRG
jgi:hypothetical protein